MAANHGIRLYCEQPSRTCRGGRGLQFCFSICCRFGLTLLLSFCSFAFCVSVRCRFCLALYLISEPLLLSFCSVEFCFSIGCCFCLTLCLFFDGGPLARRANRQPLSFSGSQPTHVRRMIPHASPFACQSKRISPFSWDLIMRSIACVPKPWRVGLLTGGPPLSVQRRTRLRLRQATVFGWPIASSAV
jgi:hypothetical protein